MADTEPPFVITQGNARDVKELFNWFGGHEQRITLYDDLYDGCSKDDLNRKYTNGFLHDQINRLKGFGLVTEREDRYRLTHLGERVHDEFLDIAEYSVLISDLGPLLESIENWEDVLPQIETFENSEIIVENDLEPTKGVNRYREEIKETDELREIVCSIIDSKGFQDLIDGNSLTAECLYTPEIMEYISKDDKRREIAATHRSEGVVTHYQVDEDVPFNLTILDHATLICTTRVDAPGHRILLLSDSADVREWAIEFYKSKKQEAEKYTF